MADATDTMEHIAAVVAVSEEVSTAVELAGKAVAIAITAAPQSGNQWLVLLQMTTATVILAAASRYDCSGLLAQLLDFRCDSFEVLWVCHHLLR